MEEQLELSRYIVGIDLGTTNSSVSYVDTKTRPYRVEDFPVLQVTAPSETAALSLFPSFHYEAASGEFSEGSLKLPWHTGEQKVITGVFARDHGAQVPARLVFSAKSWLSHSGVDRTAPLLPWHGASDVDKISPLTAASRYLLHMRQAWNAAFPDYPLEKQDLTITVPASFDEVARELTVEAAAQAGLQRIVLLEEPQAAFYAWINQHAKDWQEKVNAGQKILICDIGGGTTDFSLIQVRGRADGSVEFHRIAVGDHLILGGDNLDLALAYQLEKKMMNGKRLTPRQFGALVRNCQRAKEVLLGQNPPEKMVVVVPGTGAALIGGGLQVELTQDEVVKILLNGFFPYVDITEKPVTRQSGFQEFGLPYAADPAVTKYLAAFLTSHREAAETANTGDVDPSRPDIILFNGGVFASTAIRNRMIDVLEKWYSTPQHPWSPVIFENRNPELAVSRGASYFGLVRRGGGVRITAGLARSYYIGVIAEQGPQAFCLAPAGLQEGQSVDLSGRLFDLLIRQPVEFPLYVSSRRTTDKPGDLVVIDPLEMYSLPPIRTVLRSGKKMEADIVKVILHVRLTEIGTLDLWCTEKSGNRSWKLQFDIRSATRTDISAHEGVAERAGFLDNETLSECKNTFKDAFIPKNGKTTDPMQLIKAVERITAMERNSWPPSLLRSFWEMLLELESGRSIDPQHEVRWLNFMGFSLRPGYGYAVDDWRVKQTWYLYQKGVIHTRNQACRAEWWIFWRRIAGGLTSGQQHALAQSLISSVRSMFPSEESRKKGKIEIKYGVHELAEIWRLLASLEHLQSRIKEELGGIALRMVSSREDSLADAGIWAIGRLGARVPLYGPLNELVSSQVAGEWALQLLKGAQPGPSLYLTLMLLCRKTDDRYRDIDLEIKDKVIAFLKTNNAPDHYLQLIEQAGTIDQDERDKIFGEQLPAGLRLS
ncbi:MAG: hsp70 family protein [Fibrobacter sp.]|nr:hsp70 family protein [Fibrobacter sp.]